MTTFADTFKKEVARIARKEFKAELDAIRKQVRAQRAASVSLTKQLKTLQAAVDRATRRAKTGTAGASGDGALVQVAPRPKSSSKGQFSPQSFKEQRQRLGLTQEQAAKVLGVSALSVWKWESGNAAPRASKLPGILKVMSMGKREAQAAAAKLAQ